MLSIEELCNFLIDNKITIATAESCTGGGVAAAITSVPGVSEVFRGGVVAYSNEVKSSVLGVKPETLAAYGAVSRQTVIEMAQGVKRLMHTDCALATSGIAGPGGGSAEKPVGTIWLSVICKDRVMTKMLSGDCGRTQNVQKAIENVLEMVQNCVL